MITWKETSDAINVLRAKAVNMGKELLLENDNDIFQLKCDFVAFEDETVSVLLHIPLRTHLAKLKTY